MMPMHSYQQIMMPYKYLCLVKDANGTHDHQVHSHKDDDGSL